MFARVVTSSLLSVLLAQGMALAQQTGSGQTPPLVSDDTQALPREIQQKLTAQGFKDVRVVPGSYLVSAKDKDGNPITMIIGPTSMTVLTVDQAEAPSGESNPDATTK